MEELFPREPVEIAPGAVLVPRWLPTETQKRLVETSRELAKGPAGIRHIKVGRGYMSVGTITLGTHQGAYRYGDDGFDDPKPVPPWLSQLGPDGVDAAKAVGMETSPEVWRDLTMTVDSAIINHYGEGAKMGLHQDLEPSDAPVVSLSVGDTATFRFGNTETRTKPYADIELRSGDLFVFAGPARRAFHGVPKVLQGSGPADLGLSGRLNITLRESGL